jgi:hypothetical protein
VDVLVYAAKNILFPSLAEDLIPQLLDIVATVESYRQRALAQAKNLLERQLQDKSEDTKTVAFNADEEDFLKRFNTPDDSWRTVYTTILCSCCHFVGPVLRIHLLLIT